MTGTGDRRQGTGDRGRETGDRDRISDWDSDSDRISDRDPDRDSDSDTGTGTGERVVWLDTCSSETGRIERASVDDFLIRDNRCLPLTRSIIIAR